ncbi:amidase [Haladaptatus sp. NG-SE-30]
MTPFDSAASLAAAIRRGERSPVDVVKTYLQRIRERNDVTNAYVTVCGDMAREAAREAERAVETGEDLGPLHGVPVAIKDLYAYKRGVPNTYGSAMFAEYVPEKDALVVERLEDAGAIVLGKTNTPEFGHKGVTDNALFGPTGTPFAPARTAGGSSGGSAAAVADGLAPFAQGSDGGGSIRIPAAFCGVYGLKPSFGRVPYEGRPDAFSAHTPFALAGPITRTVEDAALMLDVLAGPHPRDPMSVPDDGTDFSAAVGRSVEGLSVAYSPDLDIFAVDDRVSRVVGDAVERFSDAGATVEQTDIDFGYTRQELVDHWLTVSRVKYAAMAENLRDEGVDLLDHREEVADVIVELLEAGSDVGGVEYKRTDVPRTSVFDAIQDVFEEFDLLVTPTVAVPPFDHGQIGPSEIDGEKVNSLLGWYLTWPFNLTGHPAASVPAGSVEGLPVGMQVVGRRFADDTVLAASATFEQLEPWADRYPGRE